MFQLKHYTTNLDISLEYITNKDMYSLRLRQHRHLFSVARISWGGHFSTEKGKKKWIFHCDLSQTHFYIFSEVETSWEGHFSAQIGVNKSGYFTAISHKQWYVFLEMRKCWGRVVYKKIMTTLNMYQDAYDIHYINFMKLVIPLQIIFM